MDIADKVNLADSLYTAYTLEETIYQLAKVQSNTHVTQCYQIYLMPSHNTHTRHSRR